MMRPQLAVVPRVSCPPVTDTALASRAVLVDVICAALRACAPELVAGDGTDPDVTQRMDALEALCKRHDGPGS